MSKSLVYCRKIRIDKVKTTLKKMKNGKSIGLNNIPIETWKCLGKEGVKWFTNLFNKILRTKRMPDEWKKNILVPIFKNKGEIQSCTNYRSIKLMSHTMKLWERVIGQRLKKNKCIKKSVLLYAWKIDNENDTLIERVIRRV